MFLPMPRRGKNQNFRRSTGYGLKGADGQLTAVQRLKRTPDGEIDIACIRLLLFSV